MRLLHAAERGGDGLLRAAQRLIAELARGTAQRVGLGLRGGEHFVAAGLGDAHDLLIVHERAGALLRLIADAFGLALGVVDEFVAGGDQTLCLGKLHRHGGLDLIEDLEDLVALDDALFVAERHAPCLRHHGIKLVNEFHDFVVHFVSSQSVFRQCR